MSTRRHGTDEDALVILGAAHPHTIAEHRAAGEWTGRIDRDDADAMSLGGPDRGENIDQARLARAGWSGDAMTSASPGEA